MADDSAVVVGDDDQSEIVSEFLLKTCLRLQPSTHSVCAASLSSMFSAILKLSADDESNNVDDEVDYISLTTGSSAEFYVQPMLSFVGDIDVMFHGSDALAIPDGYSPPTELPAEFHSRVKVYEIVDSEYPGYVYLMSSYLLSEDSDAGKYSAEQYPQRRCISYGSRHNSLAENHGPAQTVCGPGFKLSFDSVFCVRCLSWPPQAADWPTRYNTETTSGQTQKLLIVLSATDVMWYK